MTCPARNLWPDHPVRLLSGGFITELLSHPPHNALDTDFPHLPPRSQIYPIHCCHSQIYNHRPDEATQGPQEFSPNPCPSLHSIFLPPYLCSYHYPHCSTPTPHPQQFKAYSSKFSRYLQILEPSKVPVRRKLSCNFHSHTSPFNKYYQTHSKHSINMFKRITGAKMEA